MYDVNARNPYETDHIPTVVFLRNVSIRKAVAMASRITVTKCITLLMQYFSCFSPLQKYATNCGREALSELGREKSGTLNSLTRPSYAKSISSQPLARTKCEHVGTFSLWYFIYDKCKDFASEACD